MPPKTMTSAQARAAADEAARVAADIEAAEAAKAEAEADRHADAVADWWRDRRATFADRVRGKRDEAWQKFADAVINGGDAVSAFARYRVVDAEVGEDLESVNRYYDDRDRAYVETATREFNELLREGGRLSAVAGEMQGPLVDPYVKADYDARREAFNARRDAFNAAYPSDEKTSIGVNFPPRLDTNAAGMAYMEPAASLSFTVAVDRVVAAHVDASLARVRQERAQQLAQL